MKEEGGEIGALGEGHWECVRPHSLLRRVMYSTKN